MNARILFAGVILAAVALSGAAGLWMWGWPQRWYSGFNTSQAQKLEYSGMHNQTVRYLSEALINKANPDPAFYRHDSTCTGFHRRHFDPALPGISSGPLTPKTLKAATGLGWTPLTGTANKIDFTQHVENAQNRLIYLLEERWIEKPGRQLLSTGSDDGLAVWVNGEPVGRHHAGRALEAGSDWYPVNLKRGYNTFLFKVDQGHGSWGLTRRLRSHEEFEEYVTRHVSQIYRDLPASAIIPDSARRLALKSDSRRRADSLHRIAWRWLPEQGQEQKGGSTDGWQEQNAWQTGASIGLPEWFQSGRLHYRIMGPTDSTLYEEIVPIYRQTAAQRQWQHLQNADRTPPADVSGRVRLEAARTLMEAEEGVYSTRMQARVLWEAAHPGEAGGPHELYGVEGPGGNVRPFRLFAPVSPAPAHSYPLVFVLHAEFDENVDSFWETYAGGSHARTARWRALAEEYNLVLALPFLKGTGQGIRRAADYLPRIEQNIRSKLTVPPANVAALAWSKSALSLFELMETRTFENLDHIGLISPWLADNPLERRRIITRLTGIYPEMKVFIRHGLDDTDVPVYLPRRWRKSMEGLSEDSWNIDYREVPGATHWNYPGDPESAFYRWITQESQSQPEKDLP